MNRPIKRGCMEVYNDYNSNLTNLFFCVKERPLALITELGFLPLNSRDDFEAIYRQLKCEEFDDEYLAIELELADKYFSPLHAKAIKALLLKRAQRGNVRRAANYYKLIRYSFSGAGKSFGGKPCNIRNFFTDIWRCSRRLENVVIENKDFESLLAQYDRPDAFFYSVSLVSSGQTVEVTMTNSRFRAKLVIAKQDGETKTPLSGAGFRLYDSTGNVVGEGYTDENGQIAFENLKKGSYTYQECEAPPGYALDDTVYPLDITEHGKTITVTVDNTAIPLERDGSITVTKKSTDGSTLTGAEYLLEYSTDNGASWQPVFSRTGETIEAGGCTSSVLNNGRLTVNSVGTATFSGLKADRSIMYRLTETRAPDGCTLLAEPLYTGTLPVKVDKSFSSDDCEVIDGENYCYSLYVTAVNGAMYRLPSTGGSGFAYIPIVLCILGAVLYAFTITHDTKSDEKKKEKNTHE